MARCRSALALISICILVTLSGLGDCRVPLQREEVVAGVGEKEPSDHLVLPSEKDELKEIAREAQPLSLPLERPHLRGNDGIFHGERRRGFRFGRPGGCHHGKFNRRGHRNSEHMPFAVEFLDLQAESRDFHSRMDRPLPEKRDFDPGFPKGEWRHPEEEIRGFHPREDEFRPEFGHGFPNGGEGRQHIDETGESEHIPFPEEQKESSFPHAFSVQPESSEFHSRVEEFMPLPQERDFEHGFPGREGRHGNKHGEEERENEDMHFPTESFTYTFPVQAESTEFRSNVEAFLPLPRENDFEHNFPGGERR
ncbi:hypothetical protein SUGI_0975030 [Cryptomeria japonica]|nr:hypothetical protein SUGI_0975030 [Cryptomeria japonica]